MKVVFLNHSQLDVDLLSINLNTKLTDFTAYDLRIYKRTPTVILCSEVK